MDSRLATAVTAASSKVAYSFDLGDAEKWTDASLVRRSAFRARASSWEPIEPEFVALTPTTGADGSNVVSVDVAPGRSRYTVLDHQFPTAQDWSNDPFLFLRLKGSGSEEVFELVIRFRTGRSTFRHSRYVAGLAHRLPGGLTARQRYPTVRLVGRELRQACRGRETSSAEISGGPPLAWEHG